MKNGELLGLLLFASSLATAQTITHQHPAAAAVADPNMIDGSKTPELIPDSTAWELWMLSVTAKDPDHPELDLQRQDGFLRAAGYADDELPVMRGQLQSFRITYEQMMAEYNRADAAHENPSHDELIARRDALVKETTTKMLAAKHPAFVQAFIKGEKKNMRLRNSEVQ